MMKRRRRNPKPLLDTVEIESERPGARLLLPAPALQRPNPPSRPTPNFAPTLSVGSAWRNAARIVALGSC